MQGRRHRRYVDIGLVGDIVEAHRIEFGRDRKLRAGHVLTVALGQAQYARHHRFGDFDQSLERTSFRLLKRIYNKQDPAYVIPTTLHDLMLLAKEPQPYITDSDTILETILHTLGATVSGHQWSNPDYQPKLHRKALCIDGYWCNGADILHESWNTNTHDAEAHANLGAIKHLFQRFTTFWKDIPKLPKFYPDDSAHLVLIANPRTEETLTRALQLYKHDNKDSTSYCGMATHYKDGEPQFLSLAFYTRNGIPAVIWLEQSVMFKPQVTLILEDPNIIKYSFNGETFMNRMYVENIPYCSTIDLQAICPITPVCRHLSLTTMMANVANRYYKRSLDLEEQLAQQLQSDHPINEWPSTLRRAAIMDSVACLFLASLPELHLGNNPDKKIRKWHNSPDVENSSTDDSDSSDTTFNDYYDNVIRHRRPRSNTY